MQHPDRLRTKRVLATQTVATCVLAALGLFFGETVALSVLLGAGIATLASAVFAFWVFGSYRAQEPGQLLMRLYGAELVKLVLLVGLFVAVFLLVKPLNIPALLGAYVMIQVAPALMGALRAASS